MLWAKNGGIIVKKGAIVSCDECPCDEEPPTTDGCDCCIDGDACLEYELTISGVVNDMSGDGAAWNGKYTLALVEAEGQTCVWQFDGGPTGSNPGIRFQISCPFQGDGLNWSLTIAEDLVNQSQGEVEGFIDESESGATDCQATKTFNAPTDLFEAPSMPGDWSGATATIKCKG